jgi:hypothetical protein
MSMETYANARDHPDNANLPTTNRPETILGTTITFLVRTHTLDVGYAVD